MSTFEIIIYAIIALPTSAAIALEIYDFRTGNHPFQHMN